MRILLLQGYEKAVNFFNYVIISPLSLNWYISPQKLQNKEETSMDSDRAEIIAINSLSFVAANEKYLAGYLNLSGMDLDTLRDNIANPAQMTDALAGILDYLLQNEGYLLEFAENYEIDPLDIGRARQFFPGAAME